MACLGRTPPSAIHEDGRVTLADLPLDAAFLQPGTGLTGVLRHKSQGAATVQLRRFRDITIGGEVKARAAEVTTWSLETTVEPLPEQPELPL